jgi:site-specific DNA-methyltransferase (adenine-specific)/adenine-specific DNA-methyltransferase
MVFAKNKNSWRPNRLPRTDEQTKNYTNPDNDPRGPWNSATYTGPKSVDERPNLYYGITNPNTGDVIFPQKTAVWKYDLETHKKQEQESRIYWGVNGNNRMPRLKVFLNEVGNVVPRSVLPYSDYGHTSEARTEILRIIADVPFTTPKPTRLIQRILLIATKPGDLILDSFAGSGTTGHAVLKLNTEYGGNRRFILVELDTNIAQAITAERLKRVAQGYTYRDQKGNEKYESGLGGGFRFCELGATMFDANGRICSEVQYEDLAQHIYFTETGSPMPQIEQSQVPLLGVNNATAIYLLYNGVLKDKSSQGGNVLTYSLLETLPEHAGPKIVYGNGCRIGEHRLRELGIVFKQIPYEIRER